jgi:hypothetical protein
MTDKLPKTIFRKGELRCKFWKDCERCKKDGCAVSFPKGEEHVCPFEQDMNIYYPHKYLFFMDTDGG